MRRKRNDRRQKAKKKREASPLYSLAFVHTGALHAGPGTRTPPLSLCLSLSLAQAYSLQGTQHSPYTASTLLAPFFYHQTLPLLPSITPHTPSPHHAPPRHPDLHI